MNATLAVITLPLIIWCAVRYRSRVGARPGAIMAALFWTLAVFGSGLWMWSRDAHGAGLPASIPSQSFDTSQAATALLVAALGSAVGALCVSQKLVGVPKIDFSKALAHPRLSSGMAALELVGLVLWLIGQGPNIWHREQYLDTEGPDFLVRATGAPCSILVLVGVAILALSPPRQHKNNGRTALFVLTLVWTASFIAKGTRISAIIPLILAACLFSASSRRARPTSTRVFLACGLIFLSMIFFSAAYAARSGAGGYDQLARMLGVGWAEAASGESLRRMVASVAAAFPIIEHSIDVALPWNVIAQNANPLPGTAVASGKELYLPYKWVPLAIVGELYAAIGGPRTAFIYFLLAAFLGSASRRLSISRFPFLYLVPLVIAAGLAVFSVQYPSRRFWRLVSIAAVAFLLSLMLRKKADAHPAVGSGDRDDARDRHREQELKEGHHERARR